MREQEGVITVYY